MEHKALATLWLLNLVRDETRIKQGEEGPWTSYGSYPFTAAEVAEADQLTFERGTEYKGPPDETWIAQAARLLKALALVVMLLIVLFFLVAMIINITYPAPEPVTGSIVERMKREDEKERGPSKPDAKPDAPAAPVQPGQSP